MAEQELAHDERWSPQRVPEKSAAWSGQARQSRTGASAVSVTDYRFALQVALWLLVLPWRLRRHSFSDLVQKLTSSPLRRTHCMTLDRAVYLVSRVSDLRLFRRRPFPRRCLRRSLALCRFLPRMGYPVRLHLAVRKSESLFEGHTWVSVNGRPVDERTLPTDFVALYEVPPRSNANRSRCVVGSNDPYGEEV